MTLDTHPPGTLSPARCLYSLELGFGVSGAEGTGLTTDVTGGAWKFEPLKAVKPRRPWSSWGPHSLGDGQLYLAFVLWPFLCLRIGHKCSLFNSFIPAPLWGLISTFFKGSWTSFLASHILTLRLLPSGLATAAPTPPPGCSLSEGFLKDAPHPEQPWGSPAGLHHHLGLNVSSPISCHSPPSVPLKHSGGVRAILCQSLCLFPASPYFLCVFK